jgi:hypothetical protein
MQTIYCNWWDAEEPRKGTRDIDGQKSNQEKIEILATRSAACGIRGESERIQWPTRYPKKCAEAGETPALRNAKKRRHDAGQRPAVQNALGKDLDPGPVEQPGSFGIVLNVLRDFSKRGLTSNEVIEILALPKRACAT